MSVTILTNYKSHAEHVTRLSVIAHEAYRNHMDNNPYLEYYNKPENVKRYFVYVDARQEWQDAVIVMNEIFPVSANNWFVSSKRELTGHRGKSVLFV